MFDAFIPAAYRHDSASRWNAQDAEKWLAFLARHLEYEINSPDLAWWQLHSWFQAEARRTFDSTSDIGFAASPTAALALARRMAVNPALLGGASWGTVAGVIAGSLYGIAVGIVVGFVGGIVGGVIGSFLIGEWSWYEIARARLALRRWLPWRLMSFLADAHRRGVLRQAGAVYQFRHIELQRRLATRSAKTDIVPEAPDYGSAAAPEASP